MHYLKECNSFLAGNSLRSRTRFKALDETGVIHIVYLYQRLCNPYRHNGYSLSP